MLCVLHAGRLRCHVRTSKHQRSEYSDTQWQSRLAVSGISRVNIRCNGRVAYARHSREFISIVRQDFGRGRSLFFGGFTWHCFCCPFTPIVPLSDDRIWNCHSNRRSGFDICTISPSSCVVHVWIAYTECTDHRLGRTVRHLAELSQALAFLTDSRQERIDHVDQIAG